jgi:hypothetical protein
MTVFAVECAGKEIRLGVFHVSLKKHTFLEAVRIHIATQEFIIRLHFPTHKDSTFM